MKNLRIGAVAASVATVILSALAVMAAPPSTFDGTPATPQPIHEHPDYSTLDVQVHSRDNSSWTSLPPINAQHGADCSGPPNSHQNTSYEGSVFICANHVMTAISGEAGYALIVLTPNLVFDFSQGGSVTFDLSTDRMSTRDWWDVTVSPFAEAQALPLLSDLSQGVDLQNPNRNSIVVTTDNGQGAPNLKVVRNGAVQSYPYNNTLTPSTGITPGTNEAAARQPFKLTVADGRIKFERLASATGSALVFFDVAATANFTSGVVQFAHHSYTPTKDGAGVPATWHWDNLDANPSTQFYIGHASPRALFSTGTVTYDAAPSGAFLRFSAICRPVVNGVAPPKMTDSGHPEHASSYMVPVPAGSTSATISFTPDDWYNHGCHGKDFTIWSLASSGEPTPPTSTATPTATSTSPAPTLTPTSTSVPTATAAATSTATPTATATATPSSTPTPTPTPQACRVQVRSGFWWVTVYTGTMVSGECRR